MSEDPRILVVPHVWVNEKSYIGVVSSTCWDLPDARAEGRDPWAAAETLASWCGGMAGPCFMRLYRPDGPLMFYSFHGPWTGTTIARADIEASRGGTAKLLLTYISGGKLPYSWIVP